MYQVLTHYTTRALAVLALENGRHVYTSACLSLFLMIVLSTTDKFVLLARMSQFGFISDTDLPCIYEMCSPDCDDYYVLSADSRK